MQANRPCAAAAHGPTDILSFVAAQQPNIAVISAAHGSWNGAMRKISVFLHYQHKKQTHLGEPLL